MSIWAPFSALHLECPGEFRFTDSVWRGNFQEGKHRASLTVHRGPHSNELETMRLCEVRDRFICEFRDDPTHYAGKHWEYKTDPEKSKPWFTESKV